MDEKQCDNENQPLTDDNSHSTQLAIPQQMDPEEVIRLTQINFDTKAIRWIVTSVLVLTWICLGLNNEIIPPSAKGLIANTNSNMERFGYIMSIRGIGYLLGSILGGFSADLFPNCMLLQHSIALGLFAISCFVIPLCRKVDHMSAAFFLAGFAHATLTSSGNPLIGRVWANKSKGVFNLIHSGYGFGAILTPIIIYIMFKTNLGPMIRTSTVSVNETTTTTTTASIYQLPAEENYVAVFFVVGVYSALMAAVTSGLYVYLLMRQRRICRSMNIQVPIKQGKRSPLLYMIKIYNRLKKIYTGNNSNKSSKCLIFLVFIAYCNLIGNDKVTNKYLYIYIDSKTQSTVNSTTADNNTTNSQDSLIIQMSYWIGFSFTRFFSFFLLKAIPIFIFYQVHLTLTLVTSIILNFVPLDRIGLIVVFVLFAIIKAPLYPTGMGLILLNGTISGLIVMLINLGASIGSTLYPYLAGYLMKKFNNDLYTNIIFASALFLFIFGTLYSQLLRRQVNRRIVDNGSRKSIIEVLPPEESSQQLEMIVDGHSTTPTTNALRSDVTR